jgi:OmpA-OmpF porin, OOP family
VIIALREACKLDLLINSNKTSKTSDKLYIHSNIIREVFMNYLKKILPLILFICLPAGILFAQDDIEMIKLYEGSQLRYDDNFGFEEFPVIMNESTVRFVEGNLRRLWCQAPAERSPLEVIKNYESAIEQKGGIILFSSRNPKSVEFDGKKLSDLFKTNRKERGLATNVFSFTSFPEEMSEFFVAKLISEGKDIFVTIASGYGHWAASQSNTTFFEIVLLEAEPMEMDKVTMDAMKEGLAVFGRIAVYNIYFDKGESTVRPESDEALNVIADYLKENSTRKFLVVGHTDNTGGYEMNISLSEQRAKSVTEKLVNEYNIHADQLLPVGVGPACPVLSNSAEEGRARNRRVEIVER